MQKPCGNKAAFSFFSEREPVQALDENLQATSCVARDDRDGCSRYRAAKISPFGDELGWYREYFFLAPIVRGGVFVYQKINVIPSKSADWRGNPPDFVSI